MKRKENTVKDTQEEEKLNWQQKLMVKFGLGKIKKKIKKSRRIKDAQKLAEEKPKIIKALLEINQYFEIVDEESGEEVTVEELSKLDVHELIDMLEDAMEEMQKNV